MVWGLEGWKGHVTKRTVISQVPRCQRRDGSKRAGDCAAACEDCVPLLYGEGCGGLHGGGDANDGKGDVGAWYTCQYRSS